MDSTDLRASAQRLRDRATIFKRTFDAKRGRSLIDAYTTLITEYDALALQLERLADEFG